MSFTRFLVAKLLLLDREHAHRIAIQEHEPHATEQLAEGTDCRYSPIFAAYLTPGAPPPPIPAKLESMLFVYSRRPYRLLGQLRPALTQHQRERAFFSQGLASLLFVNIPTEDLLPIIREFDAALVESWQIRAGVLTPKNVSLHFSHPQYDEILPEFDFRAPGHPLSIYTEQVKASLIALWQSHSIYFRDELETLRRVSDAYSALLDEFDEQQKQLKASTSSTDGLAKQAIVNSITAAVVELAAALSYCVTQGTTGAAPVLTDRSPFPHRSLLGAGTAVRALTIFSRYLESALVSRSAYEIVMKFFPTHKVEVARAISSYDSGKEYRIDDVEQPELVFDRGGAFPEDAHVPLLTQFSLRHGFKESKFAVTAASESLNSESASQWTLITLSHEIMHSRVRGIFDALFGSSSDSHGEAITQDVHDSFRRFVDLSDSNDENLRDGLRNAVLNYCCAQERLEPVTTRRTPLQRRILIEDLRFAYRKHRRKAVELFVHFHDYYFSYARQPKVYAMSIWASWIRVASPVARPSEYLVRSLATLASGTGLPTADAFSSAESNLLDALNELEGLGLTSPLFAELRRLLSTERELILRQFDLAYYLIDQVAMCFASRKVAALIDRLDLDPFAEGTTRAEDYGASVFAFGDDGDVSPVRFAMASLVRSLRGTEEISDSGWLGAWNSLVISSQEVR